MTSDRPEASTGRVGEGGRRGAEHGLRVRLARLLGAGARDRRPGGDADPVRLGRDGRFLPDYVPFDDEL
jgi:hypothetical protein